MCVYSLTALYRSYSLQVHVVAALPLSSDRPHSHLSPQSQYTIIIVSFNLHVCSNTRLTGISSIHVSHLFIWAVSYFHLVGVTYVVSGRGPTESKGGCGIGGVGIYTTGWVALVCVGVADAGEKGSGKGSGEKIQERENY